MDTAEIKKFIVYNINNINNLMLIDSRNIEFIKIDDRYYNVVKILYYERATHNNYFTVDIFTDMTITAEVSLNKPLYGITKKIRRLLDIWTLLN
jgi:hypothetical protein